MTGAPHSPSVEERLRAFLRAEAEEAMTTTDTQAELRRFQDRVSKKRRGRSRAWVAAAAAVALLGAGITAGLLSRDPGPARTLDVAGTIDAPAPAPAELVEAELRMSGAVGDAAFPAAGAMWRLASDTDVDRIDPESGSVTTIELGVSAVEPLVEAAGLVWFAGRDGAGERLFALDPATNEIVRKTAVLGGARWVASGPAGLWVITGARELSEIDPASARVVRTVPTQQDVYDLLVGDGAVYSGAVAGGRGLTVVDTRTGRARTVLPDVAPGPFVLAADGDLWLNDAARGALVRYDGNDFRQVAAIELGQQPSRGARRDFWWDDRGIRNPATEGSVNSEGIYPVIVGDSLFAAFNRNGTSRLLRAEVGSGAVTGVVQLGDGIAIGPVTTSGDSLWVGWRSSDVVRRLAVFE